MFFLLLYFDLEFLKTGRFIYQSCNSFISIPLDHNYLFPWKFMTFKIFKMPFPRFLPGNCPHPRPRPLHQRWFRRPIRGRPHLPPPPCKRIRCRSPMFRWEAFFCVGDGRHFKRGEKLNLLCWKAKLIKADCPGVNPTKLSFSGFPIFAVKLESL